MGRRTRPNQSVAAGPAGLQDTALRVVSYRRASTDEANQPYSLDAQRTRVDTYVAAQENWTLAGDYVERASGKDVAGRPELQRLLADAAAGKFDIVVVARIDRWSRSLVDLLDTVNELGELDVSFVSATEHFETSTPMGRLILQMLGMFAEFERSMIIDRIERGNAAKVARGIPLNNQVGYGLTLDPETGRIVADRATIGIVRRILTEYVTQQHGLKAIATALNDDSIPGPATRPWSADSVSRVLRNRRFVGELLHRNTWLPGAHDPLVDVPTFEAAQVILDRRAADPAAAARNRKSDFLLSGTIHCGHCQGAYVGTAGTSRSGHQVRYYSCGTKRRYGAKQCHGVNVPAAELETLVIEALLEVYGDSSLFQEAIDAAHERHQQRHEPATAELASVNAAIAAKDRVLARYRKDYEAGELGAGLYTARATELEDDLFKLRARAAQIEVDMAAPALPTVPDQSQLAETRALIHAGVRGPNVAVRRELLQALIERIDVRDLDDIDPTFRLLDADRLLTLAAAAGDAEDTETFLPPQPGEETPDSLEAASSGARFANRRTGWS